MAAEKPATDTFRSGAPGLDWRNVLASGLYHTGLLRVMRGISQSFEVQFSRSSAWPRWRRLSSAKFVILCYHRVGEGGVPLYSELPRGIFEAQMRHVKKHYRLLSLEEICRGLEDPERAQSGVAVTFDDGYRGVYEEAFPILRKYQIPTTVFLTVNAIETGQVAWYDRIFLALSIIPKNQLDLELDGMRHFSLSSARERLEAAIEIISCLRKLPDWRRKECCAALEMQVELPQAELADRMMNWQQVRTMQRAGISFGSHTVSHPVVNQLTLAEMERELAESKQFLEAKLACPILDFAFPFGQLHDCGIERTSPIVVRCGYRSASTTVPGVNTLDVNPFGLLRVQIGEERNLAMFAFRLSQLFLLADSGRPHVLCRPEPSSSQHAGREQSQAVQGTRNA
jgi:peptidoglycan/xylan/chitin deacetylase (PgdA/CDA1 family)